jgi:hypothetical protein
MPALPIDDADDAVPTACPAQCSFSPKKKCVYKIAQEDRDIRIDQKHDGESKNILLAKVFNNNKRPKLLRDTFGSRASLCVVMHTA